MKVTDFAAGTPSMAPDAYFPGHEVAYGIFVDRFGNVRNQFTVDCHGAWDGKTLTLKEHFTYVGGPNGQPTDREWFFHRTGPHAWYGYASDVPDGAVGEDSGNGFHMTYGYDLHTSAAGTTHVHISDWMFRESDNAVVNHTVFSKDGIDLGSAQIGFYKK